MLGDRGCGAGDAARKTKIVCTIGPATADIEVQRRLIRAGLDVARINFSHGTHDGHARMIRQLRTLAEEEARPVAILADLSGVKIRTTAAAGDPVALEEGATAVLSPQAVPTGPEAIGTTYPALADDLAPGQAILIDDGRIRLRVAEIRDGLVRCIVEVGGVLRDRVGIHLPETPLDAAPSLTDKDRADLAFALAQGADLVALSFVRRAEDLAALESEMDRCGRRVPSVAKLEKPQALENLDEIIERSWGLMVARGDLGVELPPEEVPVAQKRIISQGVRHHRPVITATQMLDSMTQNPRPTRAEASDVANAVLDGTDAVMLSGETAIGRYPVETVAMMDRIVRCAEAFARPERKAYTWIAEPEGEIAAAAADAAVLVAETLGARALVAFTMSGRTALLAAKRRPRPTFVAVTANPGMLRALGLAWGIRPYGMDLVHDVDALLARVERLLRGEGIAGDGDIVVILAGAPLAVPGTTNFLRIHRMGESPCA
ncbi:MAG: pyruvate kinase [Planctomycetes bacterium]|nr:pyruvate kinase [Planctomycetota bacterium]